MNRLLSTRGSIRRTYAIGLGAALLLLATVITGIYLGLQTRQRFQDVAASWATFAERADKKGLWISEIRGHLGYGGIIHDFKNYVLRQDERYVDAVKRRLTRFYSSIDAYLASDTTAEERDALGTIRATIENYESRIPIAERAAREGWPTEQTDRLVKVDDTSAVAAFARLESIWREARERTTSEIAKAVTEGSNLIELGFRFLVGLVLVGLSLFALYYLLMRELHDAMRNLANELTERMRAEQAEKKLRRAVEQSPATIMITDTSGHIEYVNRRFEELTGYDQAEVLGATPKFLQSGDTSNDQYAVLRGTLAQGEEWHGVFRNRKKDGGSFWAETTILPLTDDEGVVRNYIGIGEDITEKRKAREQVIKAQKMEAVGLLAGGVAHDFNNVLTTIMGAAHLASLDAAPDSDIAREIAQIEIAARRAQALVQQLLTFARRQPGAPRKLDLKREAEEVARLIRASIPPTIKVESDFCDSPTWVTADPTQLHQVIMNLCRNAAEAVPSDAGLIRIALHSGSEVPQEGSASQDREGSWVKLSIEDNGPGIPPQVARQVFDPFFTTKPLGKGTGLGLTMVATLVEDMGGSVMLASSDEGGARFEVLLPEVTPGQAAHEEREALPRGSEQILLVDDEADLVSTYRRLLMRLGYRVAAYTDPNTALAAFKSEPSRFDLVMTDLVMPDMNGEVLAAQVRRAKPDCPVIICTAYRPKGFDKIETAHVVVLDKPVQPAELARQIRKSIDAAVGVEVCPPAGGAS